MAWRSGTTAGTLSSVMACSVCLVGGCAMLTDYVTSKGYLDFTASGKLLGAGTGFWVNRP